MSRMVGPYFGVVAMLIYDGECGLCRNSAKWCRRRLPAEVDVVASQQFSDSELAAMGISRADVMRAAWWIEDGRPPAEGAVAIARSLTAIGGREAVIGRVLGWPVLRVLAQWAYRWVADNRTTTSRWLARLPGRSRNPA